MTAKIIDGKRVAQNIKNELQKKIAKAVESGHRPPCLAVILVGHDPASEVYVGHKKKACTAVGITSKSLELPEDTTQEKLNQHLEALNADSTVDGILLQLPLPKHLCAHQAIDMINPQKDVDGLTPVNQGLLVWKRPGLISCTPAGILELLKSEDIELRGKRAVVMGRSVLVGAPVATLLSNAGATVHCLNSKTQNTPEITRQADILIVATGVSQLVKGDWIKPGAVVIDVGMHRINNKLSGDVAFDEAKEVASAITPVPGGVGPMTIAMLLANCYEAFAQKHL